MEIKQQKIAGQKLAILYFLHKASVRVSEQRLTEANAELALMDYFNLQTNLHDMLENHLILRQEAVNGRFFRITDVGETTLEFFIKDLLQSIRHKIDGYLTEYEADMRLESNIYAEYVRIAESQYRVILRMIENDVPVFEVSFFAQTHIEADKYVQAWRKNAMKVYSQMFETLLSDEEA